MKHQKRLSAPKQYPIDRKDGSYISTLEGSRSNENAIPAVLFLREVTGFAETKKEAKKILKNGKMLRNGEELRNIREGVGVLDVVELPDAEKAYRTVRDGDDLEFVEVDDSEKVAAKVVGKRKEGDRYVYRLHNGENYSTKDEFSTGNTLIFNGGVEEVELEEGAEVLAIDGRHAGQTGTIEEIQEGMKSSARVSNGEEFLTELENLVAVKDIELGDR
jgi:small subunit ribosomal protein S4e